MYLTFEVISANASALGAHRRKVFTVDGGRIGRSPDNDMVLPGVGVHRHHATVRFINGVFFVEGVGTNGIAINNPEVVLPRNEPYPLKSGDKVFIDEYEVAVTASTTAPPEPAVARQPERTSARPAPGTPAQGPRVPLFDASDEPAEDLDPLRKLVGGGGPSAARAREAAPSPSQSPSWNHSSSLADHFTPPAAAPSAPPAAAANVIPENWDRTTFDRSKLQQQSAQTYAPPPSQPPHAPQPHSQPQ